MQLKENKELEFKLQIEKDKVKHLNQQLNKLRNNETELNKFPERFKEKKNDRSGQQVIKGTSDIDNSILKWED